MKAEYDVCWADSATQELTAGYLAARGAGWANAVTQTVVEAEQLLSRRPRDVGESRNGLFRILCLPPLVFEYYIIEDDKRVYITGLRFAPPHWE